MRWTWVSLLRRCYQNSSTYHHASTEHFPSRDSQWWAECKNCLELRVCLVGKVGALGSSRGSNILGSNSTNKLVSHGLLLFIIFS